MNVVKKKLRNKMGNRLMSDYLICYVLKTMFLSLALNVLIDLFEMMKIERGTQNVSDLTYFFCLLVFNFKLFKLTCHLLQCFQEYEKLNLRLEVILVPPYL